MASARELLAGKCNGLLRPANFASPFVAVGAVYYATLTMEFPGETVGALLAFAFVLLPIFVVFGLRRYRRALRTLCELEAGILRPTPDGLERAAREVQGVADVVFRTNVQVWPAGIGLLLVGLKLWVASLPTLTLVRLAVCGLALFPLGAVLSYVLVARRARAILPLLLELGLAPERLALAVPPARASVRKRLMVLSAVLVLTPSAVIADLTLSALRRGIQRMEVTEDQIDQAEAMDHALAEATRGVLILGLAVFAVALATAYLAAGSLTKPMRSLAREVRRLEAGELDAPVVVPADDELWSVSSAYSAMRAQLTSALTDVRRAGLRVSGTAEQLVEMAAGHRSASIERISAIEQTSVGAEELARVAQSISATSADVAAKAEETFAAASACMASAEALLTAMSVLKGNNRKISESAESLRDSGDQIRRAVQLVAVMGERADLLALSAELEGTRASDAGRGFALVAAEMHRLGQEVIRSTAEIDGLLEDVRDASEATLAVTEAGLATTNSTVELGRTFAADLQEIIDHAKVTADSAAEISRATGSERENSVELAMVMGDVLALSQQGEAATFHLADQTDALARVSRDLRQLLETFQVKPPPGRARFD